MELLSLKPTGTQIRTDYYYRRENSWTVISDGARVYHYVGETDCNGLPNGLGVAVEASRDEFWRNWRYKGSFKNGKFHGLGLFMMDGACPFYTGEFRNGVKHGKGTYTFWE